VDGLGELVKVNKWLVNASFWSGWRQL